MPLQLCEDGISQAGHLEGHDGSRSGEGMSILRTIAAIAGVLNAPYRTVEGQWLEQDGSRDYEYPQRTWNGASTLSDSKALMIMIGANLRAPWVRQRGV